MAMDKTTVFAAPAKLINHGASGAINFSTGGNTVGELLHYTIKGVERMVEVLPRQDSPGAWDGRWLGDVATLEVIVGQRTDEFMRLAYKPQYQSGTPTLIGAAQLKRGHLLKKGGHTWRLQVRAIDDAGVADTTKPHIYIPHGFVARIGPTVWDVQGEHLAATLLTILCFNDSSGTPYYEDIPASLPAVGA